MATKYGTAQIGHKQATSIFHAIRFANDNGRPLTIMVTLHLTEIGLSDHSAGDFFRDVRSRMVRSWRYENQKCKSLGSFDDVSVHANPTGGGRHVHWLVRVPEQQKPAFKNKLEKRLQKMTGLDCLGKALHFREIETAGSLAKYILKGVDPAYGDYFHMTTQDEGFVIGRRTSTSRSIGTTARQNAGWKRKRRRKG